MGTNSHGSAMPAPPAFSLMFFSTSAEASSRGAYALVVDSARFADEAGFDSVWIPERHFGPFGGLFPNPAVVHAGLATATRKIGLRAGSVVAPLHHPLRIAEEWSVVDNLSGGRVGISFAPGWNPSDFAFFPGRYDKRHEENDAAIAAVQHLWRGGKLSVQDARGRSVEVATWPRPVQPELPAWLTAASGVGSFENAGRLGLNLLTHLLDLEVEELAERIARYRAARERYGHDPGAGRVSLMIHTFVTGDAEEAARVAREPYCEFLMQNRSLAKGLASSRGRDVDVGSLSDQDLRAIILLVYDRFVTRRSLIGSPESCLPMVAKLRAAGVDELACLLDFGPTYEDVARGLPHLVRLRDISTPERLAKEELRGSQTSESTGVRAPEIGARERLPQADTLLAVRERCTERVSGQEASERLRGLGLDLDGGMSSISEIHWREGEEVLLELTVDEPTDPTVTLDHCLQAAVLALPRGERRAGSVSLPWSIERLRVLGKCSGRVQAHLAMRALPGVGDTQFSARARVLSATGDLLAEADNVVFRSPSFGEQDQALESWIYQPRWQELGPAIAERFDEPCGTWLIFADRGGLGAALAATLAARGDSSWLIVRGRSRAVITGGYQIDPDSDDDYRWLLEQTLQTSGKTCHIALHLWSLDAASNDELSGEELERAQAAGAASIAAWTRAVGALKGGAPRLWIVTQGAQSPDQQLPTLAHAATWGFAEIYATECAELCGGLIDLSPLDALESRAKAVVTAVLSRSGEKSLVSRGGGFYVPRLARRPKPFGEAPHVVASAAYLITGGLGGIGMATARWLVDRGARQLILLGRSLLPPRTEWAQLGAESAAVNGVDAIRELERAGAHVEYVALDVADRAALADYLKMRDAQGLARIRGVVHAAGVSSACQVRELTKTELDAVCRPKVAGAWNLHSALRDTELDFFVMFSSAPPRLGVLGHGLASYNAANSFLDALARYRARLGLPALSVAWGPWCETGLHTRGEAAQRSGLQSLSRLGIGGITTRNGLRALGGLMGASEPEVWAVPIDWKKLLSADRELLVDRFFAGIAEGEEPDRESEADKRAREERVAKLKGLPRRRQHQLLVEHLRQVLTPVMGLRSPNEVDWRAGLFELGFDSLMVVEVRKQLQRTLGVTLPATAVFEETTVDGVARRLQTLLFGHDTLEEAPAAARDVALRPSVAAAVDSRVIQQLDEVEMERLLIASLDAMDGGLES